MSDAREVLEMVAKAVQEEMQGTWSYDSIVQAALWKLRKATERIPFFDSYGECYLLVKAITELEL